MVRGPSLWASSTISSSLPWPCFIAGCTDLPAIWIAPPTTTRGWRCRLSGCRRSVRASLGRSPPCSAPRRVPASGPLRRRRPRRCTPLKRTGRAAQSKTPIVRRRRACVHDVSGDIRRTRPAPRRRRASSVCAVPRCRQRCATGPATGVPPVTVMGPSGRTTDSSHVCPVRRCATTPIACRTAAGCRAADDNTRLRPNAAVGFTHASNVNRLRVQVVGPPTGSARTPSGPTGNHTAVSGSPSTSPSAPSVGVFL